MWCRRIRPLIGQRAERRPALPIASRVLRRSRVDLAKRSSLVTIRVSPSVRVAMALASYWRSVFAHHFAFQKRPWRNRHRPGQPADDRVSVRLSVLLQLLSVVVVRPALVCDAPRLAAFICTVILSDHKLTNTLNRPARATLFDVCFVFV